MSHNHKKCIKTSLEFAHKVSQDKAMRLTPQRLQVLKILLDDHKALGAYEILERLRDMNLASQTTPQPPTVYRALDFLLEMGLVHKVESQNSYYACMIERSADGVHIAQAFICESCGAVEEKTAEASVKKLYEKAATFGFEVNQVIMECRGFCANCQKQNEFFYE